MPKLADKNLNLMDTMGKLVDSMLILIDRPAPVGLAAQTGGLNSKFDGYNGQTGG